MACVSSYVLCVQVPMILNEAASFEEYLRAEFDPDEVTETYIDPLSLRGAPKVASGHSDEVSLVHD